MPWVLENSKPQSWCLTLAGRFSFLCEKPTAIDENHSICLFHARYSKYTLCANGERIAGVVIEEGFTFTVSLWYETAFYFLLG